jgi:hypothetical protein
VTVLEVGRRAEAEGTAGPAAHSHGGLAPSSSAAAKAAAVKAPAAAAAPEAPVVGPVVVQWGVPAVVVLVVLPRWRRPLLLLVARSPRWWARLLLLAQVCFVRALLRGARHVPVAVLVGVLWVVWCGEMHSKSLDRSIV